MCPKSAHSVAAVNTKKTKMSTSTASITTVTQSNSNFQKRTNNKNYSTIHSNINFTSGTIRIGNSQGKTKFETNSYGSNNDVYDNLRTSKRICFTAAKRRRRKIALTSQKLLLTFLLSVIFIQQTNSTITIATTAINEMLFLSTSPDNVSTAMSIVARQNITSPVEVKPETTTNSTKSVKSEMPLTPIASSTMPPALSLISATTITNAHDTLPADDIITLPPALEPEPKLTPLSLLTPSTTKAFLTSESPIEILTIETVARATATDDNAENAATILQPPPSSDVLIKGFSIPTFLPPFPAFSMADLPSYTSAPPASADVIPTASTDPQNQLYLASIKQNSAAQNLSLQETNVTVQLGNHAYLPCNIQRILNKPISWVRLRDGHILSVDQATFISDQRFQSIFQSEDEETWSLQIKYVQDTDEGWYECQVSSEPKMSAKVYLGVVVPHTELIGDQNRFVKAGSKVALHCIVRDTLDPPTYIIWFRGKTQITNDNEVGWYTEIDRTIFGDADSNRNTIGSLIIPHVRKKDSGNYTCQPSNSAPVSVDLHVLSGEYSASAIMSTASSFRLNENITYFILLAMILFVVPKT